MRSFFFGDIHGNATALERCLSQLRELDVDQAYCMGDLVGWLPFGNRTLERMRLLDLPTVAGNHDLLVAGLLMDRPNQIDRMQASAYNAGLLSTIPGAISYLARLPLLIEREDFVVVHHSPFHLPQPRESISIASFDYLNDAALMESLAHWQNYPKRLIFSGHDHIPAVYELPDSLQPPTLADVIIHRPKSSEPLSIKLDPHSRYWVKAGSVGGPYRDNVPVCNTVLYDKDAATVTLFRLTYPTASLYSELVAHRFSQNIPTLKRYAELLFEKNP